MALVVETGEGLPDAEVYISVADAEAYLASRGNTAWGELSEPAKEASLRQAADYLAAMYGRRWCGHRATDGQALDWPRTGHDGVPVALARMNAELAARASLGQLMADEGAAVQSETVGPISVTYAKGNTGAVRYTAIDAALKAAGLFCVRPGFIPAIRA